MASCTTIPGAPHEAKPSSWKKLFWCSHFITKGFNLFSNGVSFFLIKFLQLLRTWNGKDLSLTLWQRRDKAESDFHSECFCDSTQESCTLLTVLPRLSTCFSLNFSFGLSSFSCLALRAGGKMLQLSLFPVHCAFLLSLSMSLHALNFLLLRTLCLMRV